VVADPTFFVIFCSQETFCYFCFFSGLHKKNKGAAMQ